MPESDLTLLFLNKNSNFLSGFKLLFLIKLWYAFSKLILEGVAIRYFLDIFLLTEAKSAKFLFLAISFTANSNLSMNKEYANYLLNKTKNDYNLIADDFSRTRAVAWQETSFLFSGLKPGENVLDLGCGNGRFYELLKNTNYTGVDNSEKLIKIAKQKYPKAKFQIGDALNLNFPNNYFGKIYSIAVLHHIPSKELRCQFLKEAKRILKKDGKLILTVWKSTNSSLLIKYTILKIIGKTKLDFKDTLEPWSDKTDRYYHWFSKNELASLVKQAGFKIEKIGVIKNEKGNRQNIYIIAKPL